MANNEYLNKNLLNSYGTNWLFDILTPNTGSFVYKSIPDDLIEVNNKIKIRPAWNNGQEILSSVYTASQAEKNYKDYTLSVYSSTTCNQISKEFTIEYGHKDGYGTTYEYITQKTETNAIFKKYKNLLDDNLENEYTSIFALKFNNTDTQNGLYSDFFTVKIANPQTQSLYTSVINYDFFISQSSYPFYEQSVSRLVSGSLENGIYYENGSPVFFGKIYTNHSIVILNPEQLNTRLNLGLTQTVNTNSKNAEKMYLSISSSIQNMNSHVYNYWAVINTKKINPTLTIPIRISANEFNYSTNPTFYDENGKIKTADFKTNPTSYFTSIGLYNDKYELLAIGKFSKPFKKDFTEQFAFEVNIEIK